MPLLAPAGLQQMCQSRRPLAPGRSLTDVKKEVSRVGGGWEYPAGVFRLPHGRGVYFVSREVYPRSWVDQRPIMDRPPGVSTALLA